jgi:hypothetical protein
MVILPLPTRVAYESLRLASTPRRNNYGVDQLRVLFRLLALTILPSCRMTAVPDYVSGSRVFLRSWHTLADVVRLNHRVPMPT